MRYLCLLLTAGCYQSVEQADQETVARQQAQYQTAQPVPAFDFSQERDAVIQLYEARNKQVATWTVWRSDTGIIEGDCPSIAFPIPYDTSLTNPLQISWMYRNATFFEGVVEQPEPNGTFSSKNSNATWVRCTVKHGGRTVVAPIYIESKVTAYPFPVQVDYENNRVIFGDADPSVVIESNQ